MTTSVLSADVRVLPDPVSDFRIGSAIGHEALERIRVDSSEVEKLTVKRAVEFVLPGALSEHGPALVERSTGDHIAAEGFARTSGKCPGKVFGEKSELFVHSQTIGARRAEVYS
jgi:hypothetical protein